MVAFSNKASEALGSDAFPASFSLPIVDALQVTVFIRMFLDNIFGAILFLLVLLSALLVYSLLLGDVESKTYEYGMLRALGMRHSSLMQILLIKSSAFSLLGISIGLFIAWVANIPVAILVADYASIAPHLGLTGGAVLTAVLLGWLMPGVANIVPIQRALSSTLRDALDIYHHTASEISVSIQRLADKGLDLWQTVLSVFMIVVGFVVFYLIPYAFTFRNFSVFLGLLNAILMGMLFGLAILASLVQPYLEKMWTFVMVRWSHSKLRPLVLKNLSAHRDRNSKTAHMFVICLAFVVFAGVMFSLQTKSIADNVRVLFGADLFILAPTLADALRETEMSQHLDSLILKGGCVVDYTFVTFDLAKTAAIQSAQFANLPTFPSFSQPIFGVQSNYLNVAFNQFAVTVSPASLDTKTASGKPDPVASLWHPFDSPFALSSNLQSLVVGRTDPGYGDQSRYRNEFMQQMAALYNSTIPLVVSAALSDFASVSANTALQVTITAKAPPQGVPDAIKETRVYLCRANAMVSKMPSFYYSSYSQTVRASPVLMRMSDFDTILQQAYQATGNAALAPAKSPKAKLLVKLKPNTPREQREDVLNGLRNFFTSNKIVSQDTQTVLDSTQSAADLLNLFFNVVGLIAMSLCFFILLLSFTANVNENAWEFGVLRAIGLSDVQVCAVYVYEALALALSCIMSGTLVGILIAISLTLQFNLFTEMPFEFAFPYALFFSMVLLSLICAVYGSYQPAQKLLRKSISNTIRGL
jgi:ABC-type antimicrobial peptide transport system permease subunit